ncbi:hypothetical protein PAPYR_1162 [Paratrimastix pyriformis]|uniref:Cyclin N-terminal domain-containing protein n=1 Tax=Paratrimastix pyriformis TaxID=342808 RepID=A0ABQ8UWQ7_9EUKA|nr:hypothetical protein PAPYR_1162 [Paratrimastix pyriformis]
MKLESKLDPPRHFFFVIGEHLGRLASQQVLRGAGGANFQTEPTHISLEAWAERIYRAAPISPSLLVTACLYLSRIRRDYPQMMMNSLNIRRLFLCSCLLAAKVFEDKVLGNVSWAAISGGVYSIKMINQMEIELLLLLHFRLFVSPEEFHGFFNERLFLPYYDVVKQSPALWARRRDSLPATRVTRHVPPPPLQSATDDEASLSESTSASSTPNPTPTTEIPPALPGGEAADPAHPSPPPLCMPLSPLQPRLLAPSESFRLFESPAPTPGPPTPSMSPSSSRISLTPPPPAGLSLASSRSLAYLSQIPRSDSARSLGSCCPYRVLVPSDSARTLDPAHPGAAMVPSDSVRSLEVPASLLPCDSVPSIDLASVSVPCSRTATPFSAATEVTIPATAGGGPHMVSCRSLPAVEMALPGTPTSSAEGQPHDPLTPSDSTMELSFVSRHSITSGSPLPPAPPASPTLALLALRREASALQVLIIPKAAEPSAAPARAPIEPGHPDSPVRGEPGSSNNNNNNNNNNEPDTPTDHSDPKTLTPSNSPATARCATPDRAPWATDLLPADALLPPVVLPPSGLPPTHPAGLVPKGTEKAPALADPAFPEEPMMALEGPPESLCDSGRTTRPSESPLSSATPHLSPAQWALRLKVCRSMSVPSIPPNVATQLIRRTDSGLTLDTLTEGLSMCSFESRDAAPSFSGSSAAGSREAGSGRAAF